MTMVAYRVECDDLVDLTDPAGRAAADATPTDLACPWEAIVATGATPPSWRLAPRRIAAGAAGLLVPSFAVGATERDVNVVFWRRSPERPHRVEVIDDHRRLPRDDRSWR